MRCADMTKRPAHRPALYEPPAPALLRQLRDEACITQRECAEIARAKLKSWQNWEAEPGTGEHRAIPAGSMELFCFGLACKPYIAPGDWLLPWVRPEFLRLLRITPELRAAVIAITKAREAQPLI